MMDLSLSHRFPNKLQALTKFLETVFEESFSFKLGMTGKVLLKFKPLG